MRGLHTIMIQNYRVVVIERGYILLEEASRENVCQKKVIPGKRMARTAVAAKVFASVVRITFCAMAQTGLFEL